MARRSLLPRPTRGRSCAVSSPNCPRTGTGGPLWGWDARERSVLLGSTRSRAPVGRSGSSRRSHPPATVRQRGQEGTPALHRVEVGRPSRPCPAGRLRALAQIEDFWRDHTEAQTAIVLGIGLGCIDVDLVKLRGDPPAEFPLPRRIGSGLCETTKSHGEHILFHYLALLPPNMPTQVTGIGGYVDVLYGGLLFTAPSAFEISDRRYGVAYWGEIPSFTMVVEALGASAPRLVPPWKARAALGDAAPPSPGAPVPVLGERKPDVEHALSAIRSDPEISRVFLEGFPKPSGEPGRSQTEFRLAGLQKRRGVSPDVAGMVIQACPHTKSPRDRRGSVTSWSRCGPVSRLLRRPRPLGFPWRTPATSGRSLATSTASLRPANGGSISTSPVNSGSPGTDVVGPATRAAWSVVGPRTSWHPSLGRPTAPTPEGVERPRSVRTPFEGGGPDRPPMRRSRTVSQSPRTARGSPSSRTISTRIRSC